MTSTTVIIWNNHMYGSHAYPGHASMSIDSAWSASSGSYVSWWPGKTKDSGGKLAKPTLEFFADLKEEGYAPDHIRRHEKALQFVRDIDRQGKLIASICHGPWVLCSTGTLKGRRATSFFAIKDDVINAGAHWEDAEVVVDGHLVTSRKPEDLPAFCRESIAVVAGVAV